MLLVRSLLGHSEAVKGLFLGDLEEGVQLAVEFDPIQPLVRAPTPRQLTLLREEYRNAVLDASALQGEDIYFSCVMAAIRIKAEAP
jgi:hypothetical protein